MIFDREPIYMLGMGVALIALAVLLGSCAALPRPSLDDPPREPVKVAKAERVRCAPIPAEIRDAAARKVKLPEDRGEGGKLAGDVLLADMARTRALVELIALYETCSARAGGR